MYQKVQCSDAFVSIHQSVWDRFYRISPLIRNSLGENSLKNEIIKIPLPEKDILSLGSLLNLTDEEAMASMKSRSYQEKYSLLRVLAGLQAMEYIRKVYRSLILIEFNDSKYHFLNSDQFARVEGAIRDIWHLQETPNAPLRIFCAKVTQEEAYSSLRRLLCSPQGIEKCFEQITNASLLSQPLFNIEEYFKLYPASIKKIVANEDLSKIFFTQESDTYGFVYSEPKKAFIQRPGFDHNTEILFVDDNCCIIRKENTFKKIYEMENYIYSSLIAKHTHIDYSCFSNDFLIITRGNNFTRINIKTNRHLTLEFEEPIRAVISYKNSFLVQQIKGKVWIVENDNKIKPRQIPWQVIGPLTLQGTMFDASLLVFSCDQDPCSLCLYPIIEATDEIFPGIRIDFPTHVFTIHNEKILYCADNLLQSLTFSPLFKEALQARRTNNIQKLFKLYEEIVQ